MSAQFTYAKQIAIAAGGLDFLKNAFTATERVEATLHINTLHEIATRLAGDRANEIYPQEEIRQTGSDSGEYAARCCVGCDEA